MASKIDSIIGAATKIGVAYAGYRANDHWSGALAGLVALRLAEGGNLAGGVAGLATLAVIGLNQIPPVDKTGHKYKVEEFTVP